MKSRMLGNKIEVAPVGFGAMGISHAYGDPLTTKEGAEIIKAGINMGYTLIDTAECYTGINSDGTTAYNEEVVGEAIKGIRDKIVLSTKCGVYFGKERPFDSTKANVMRAIDESLKKLGTDYIDLYYQHRIDPQVEPEEIAETMGELIKAGKIRSWGISAAGEDYIRRAHKVTPVAAVQNRYSMMSRDQEELFPMFEELGITLVAYSPMANGFLTAAYSKNDTFKKDVDYRSNMPQYTAEGMDKNQVFIDLLKDFAAKKNATPAQISLAWMLCKKPFIVPIPGSRKLHRLEENFNSCKIELTAEELATIDKALDSFGMEPEIFKGSNK